LRTGRTSLSGARSAAGSDARVEGDENSIHSDLASQPSTAQSYLVKQTRLIGVAAAILIGIGIAWMLGTASLARFLATFGDCAPESCEGYFGVWETTARFYDVIDTIGTVAIAIAVAAMFFRIAQIALAVIAVVMIASIPLSLVAPLQSLWIPGIDVSAGYFTTVFVVQLPAAVLWLGGALLGLLTRRVERDLSRPADAATPLASG
jgi:hypothetical protein